MKGQTIYLVDLTPYHSPEVFANYQEAEDWLAEAAAKEPSIYFDEEAWLYTDEDRSYWVKTLIIK